VDGYGPDLAHAHDRGFAELAEIAAERILALLRDRGLGPGLVVELGCGSGRTARRLVEAGYDVVGFDSSAAMVALARRTAPAAHFETASFVDADLPACEAVIAVGEVLNYLFDPTADGEKALARLFRRVRAALRPGGLFVFDLAGPGRVPGPGPARAWREGGDWTVLTETEDDPRERTLTRRIATFRRTGDLYRRSDEVHRQRLYGSGQVLELLRGAGFRARVLKGYAGEPFAPGHRVYVARAGS
jgi:SAM-dependent methyltransferase